MRILAQLEIPSGCWLLAHILLLHILFWFSSFATAGSECIGSNRPMSNTPEILTTKKLAFCNGASTVVNLLMTRHLRPVVHWLELPECVSVCADLAITYVFRIIAKIVKIVLNKPLNRTVLVMRKSEFSAINPITGKPLTVPFKGLSEAMMSYQWNTNPLNTPLYALQSRWWATTHIKTSKMAVRKLPSKWCQSIFFI